MRFAKDGVPIIIAVLFLSLIIIVVGWIMNNSFSYLLYLVAIGMGGFTLFFFRDPERVTPPLEAVIAPADGKVISVDTVREDTYLGESATQVSIFLSLWDVHVNRYPVSGEVEHVSYFPGKYLVAWHPKASELNERAEFGIKHTSGVRLFYRQITGFVARRIVFYTKVGDRVSAGERFGMMKFGSRMDVLVPGNRELLVKKGDRTVAGETVIARLEQPST